MKIVLTGGASGGHFYPIIAVVEEINAIVDERNLLQPELYFISNTPYEEKVLFEHNIIYKRAPAGKLRTYFSLRNFTDSIKTFFGIVKSVFLLFKIYPDVVFSKGGYTSFPIVSAARLLRIPVFIHDSDVVPGRANLFAAPFARRIAIAYPEAIEHFKKYEEKVALVGNPVRKEILTKAKDGAHEFMGLDPALPTVLVLGGSQGAEAINDVILESLPDLLKNYQVVHQTGKTHAESVSGTAKVVLEEKGLLHHYKSYGYLNDLALRMAAGVADTVIARAGSNTIAEIAQWQIPALLVPIPENVSRDQRKNAYAYARTGAAEVLEQQNLTPHVLVAEVTRLMEDKERREKMTEAAKGFQKPDAARRLAEEIVHIALKHEE